MSRTARWTAAATAASLVVGGVLAAFLLQGGSALLVLAAALGLAVAVTALLEPFLALQLLLVLVYLRPADRIPALAPFKLQFGLGVVTVAFWLAQNHLAGRPPWVRHGVNTLLGAFLLAGIVSALPVVGLGQTATLLVQGLGSAMLLYPLLANLVCNPRRLRGTAWTLVLVGCGNVLLATADLLAGRNLFHGRLASVGLLGDPNDLCLSLVMVVPLAFALWQSERATPRLLAAVALGVLLAGCVGTGSRGGMLALVAVAWFAGLRRIRRPGARWAYAVVAAVVALGALELLLLRRGSGIAESLNDLNFRGRVAAWQVGWQMLRDHPVLGVGLYQYPERFNAYRPANFDFTHLTAHNSLVLVAAEVGLVGLTLFVGILLSLARSAGRSARLALQPAVDPRAVPLHLALAASLLGWFVAAMFLSQPYLPWLYVIAGLLVASETMLRRGPSGPPAPAPPGGEA